MFCSVCGYQQLFESGGKFIDRPLRFFASASLNCVILSIAQKSPALGPIAGSLKQDRPTIGVLVLVRPNRLGLDRTALWLPVGGFFRHGRGAVRWVITDPLVIIECDAAGEHEGGTEPEQAWDRFHSYSFLSSVVVVVFLVSTIGGTGATSGVETIFLTTTLVATMLSPTFV